MTNRLTDVLTVAVLAFVAVRLVGGVRVARSNDGRSLIGEIVRGLGWRHMWPVPLVLAAVLAVAVPLMMVPGLDWGWWSALGGDGNPVFGSSSTTAGSSWEWLVPLMFMCLLIPALPLFAHAEERMFRAGAQQWSWPRRVAKVLQFGIIHAVVGIPIGAALALSVGGAYFMGVYLRTWRSTYEQRLAELESTRAHTMYNGLIIALVGVAYAVEAAL